MINQNTISFIGTKDSHKEKLVLNLNYISEVKQSYFKEEVNSIMTNTVLRFRFKRRLLRTQFKNRHRGLHMYI